MSFTVDILYAILTLAITVLGLVLSWKLYKNECYDAAVLMLVFVGLFLRIFVSSDFYLHSWDERYHALVAKNMMQHPFIPTLYENPVLPFDYKNWPGNHIWLHKQPFPLWTMSHSMGVFGVNELALRLPSILLSSLGIWLTYSIGKVIFNRKIGVLAAFFFAVNGLIIEQTAGRVATDHIDIFFLSMIELAVFFALSFAQSKKIIFNILTGICLGAAILTKWLPALIVVPIWLFFLIESKNFKRSEIAVHFLVLAILFVGISAPWQIYIFNHFPLEAQWESSYNFKHFNEVIEGRTGSYFYFFNQIRINYGELIYLPLIWFVWTVWKKPRNFNYLALLVWIFVPLAFFTLAKTKMQGYILFTAPALFLVTAAFFFWLNERRKMATSKWFYNILLVLLLVFPLRYMIERVKPFDSTDRNPAWVESLRKFNEKKVKNGILFNYENPIEAMFYTDLTVYSEMPTVEQIDKLAKKGYSIWIQNHGPIPDEIKALPYVHIIQLAPKM